MVTTGDVYFGWAAQPAWGPLFYLGNASQATGSYAYINPSIVQENIRSLEVYNTLLADGAKIVYVDNYVHCTSLSDGLHPDNTGHFQYAQGYINAVVPSALPIFAQPSNAAPFWIWTIVGVAAVLTIGVVAHLVGGRRPAKAQQA